MPLMVLESMNFKKVWPLNGIIGIENKFYIEMDNYYPEIVILCLFESSTE